jgi:16S rRNA A1518/A1519 N6-dimethyltransferase RsmA/KsgA/DIM1 with predicted DNA glycosylase/AP lyase activity
VESVLLRIQCRERPLVAHRDRSRYEDLVTAVFGAWQPSIGAALQRLLPSWIAVDLASAAGDVAAKRPGEVQAGEWVALFDMIAERNDPRAWTALERAARKQEQDRSRIEKRHRTRAAR